MGQDIYLVLEIKRKRQTKLQKERNIKPKWESANIFDGCWSKRIYGMFAVLADLGHHDLKPIVPNRGYPKNTTFYTDEKYYKRIWHSNEEIPVDYNNIYISRKEANKWINEYHCKTFKYTFGIGLHDKIEYIENPDYHHANWCTTKEMEKCIDTIFSGVKEISNAYAEYLVLLAAMKTYEKCGFECRAIYWFDN